MYYSKNPCPWEIDEISNEAAEAVIRHLAKGIFAFIPWPYWFINTYTYSEIRWQIHEITGNRGSTTMASSIDSTSAQAYAMVNPSWNMHGSRLYTYLLVHLGAVWDIFCPSKAPSVPFKPNNQSNFEKYATEADQQHSRCVVFSFWAQSPNMVVMWHDPTLKTTECHQRCPNLPDFYRMNRHLALEILAILNAEFAMQKCQQYHSSNFCIFLTLLWYAVLISYVMRR